MLHPPSLQGTWLVKFLQKRLFPFKCLPNKEKSSTINTISLCFFVTRNQNLMLVFLIHTIKKQKVRWRHVIEEFWKRKREYTQGSAAKKLKRKWYISIPYAKIFNHDAFGHGFVSDFQSIMRTIVKCDKRSCLF